MPREDGLRTLAVRAARHKPLAQIQHALEKPNDHRVPQSVKDLVADVNPTPAATPAHSAQVFWRLILDEISKIGASEHSKRRVALQAALMLRDERQPELGRRLERARVAGKFGDPKKVGRDRPRQYWTDAVIDLARAVDLRVAQLARDPTGWRSYWTSETDTESPADPSALLPRLVDGLPLFMRRTIHTYVMSGRTVRSRTTESWVTAVADDVDHHVIRVRSPVIRTTRRRPRDAQPAFDETSIQVNTLMNCRLGPIRSFASAGGGKIHEVRLDFPRSLRRGHEHFFAVEVLSPVGEDESPIIELQITTQGIAAGRRTGDGIPLSGLTMRVQYDDCALPAAIWWFAECIDDLRLDKPADGDERRIEHRLSAHGFIEHTFMQTCRPREKYGLGWEWRQ